MKQKIWQKAKALHKHEQLFSPSCTFWLGPGPKFPGLGPHRPKGHFLILICLSNFHISGQYHSAHQKSTGICMSRHGSVLRRPYRMQEFNFLTPGSKNQGQTIEITSEKNKESCFHKGPPQCSWPCPTLWTPRLRAL